MPKFQKAVQVPYTPHQVYDVVSDISRYPDFIRWIKAMRITQPSEQDGVKMCVGEALIVFKGFSERFATRVTANPHQTFVQADLVRGPFRRLNAVWSIRDTVEPGCNCSLMIDYSFSNPLLAMLAVANHDLAVEKILGAFMSEAERRHGKAEPDISAGPSSVPQ